MEEIKAYLSSIDEEVIPSLVAKALDLIKERARQNVVLEFGYFMDLLTRNRVCCLYKGNIDLPSDMHGICYVPFQNSISEVKQTILKELEAAGYQLKKM
jgi:predicted nucleotide-binding protein